MLDFLSPFVYWAQTEDHISLKIDLTNAKNVNVNIGEKKLKFSAHGQGARGPNNYGFSLDFHSTVNPEESNYKVIDRQVDLLLIKENKAWWPRLTGQPQKPSWLKIDFDKWKSEDMNDNEDDNRDIRQDYPNMYDKLHKQEFGYRREEYKQVYLVFYNLCQFIGFFYILAVMGVKYSRDGPESMKDTYQVVGSAMKFVQLLQFLEVMHPIFGYIKGSPFIPFLQISGRAFILFFMIEAEPRMQAKPVVSYVFVVWSLIEIVRYPYYLSQLLEIEIPTLTWLRYTMWIPLYPLGFLFEGIIVLRNIPYFEETLKFTVSLPNSWNFAFHSPTVLRLYLLLLCIPGMYTVMKHMRTARLKKLSGLKRKIK
ncbi:very-long-chain (3R)-3-hydroxyacyl-CoA dehydratase [Belonocnema kinseyi]|uniref:very-long-chain (3R)-3-hydroxyacyl-CoA dehydratase n=1 Tax=Belonocnema kinseyi TaxID=2817044 RepID=UPI00143CE569|nr:very-long-chain (3R)-3-hydroxyacyl-CoA dehydratase [Belonocnema kinseyi]